MENQMEKGNLQMMISERNYIHTYIRTKNNQTTA